MRILLRSLQALAILCLLVLIAFWISTWYVVWSTPVAYHADKLLIEKRAHRLTVFAHGPHGPVVQQYRVALGRGGLEPKQRAGDNKVPEGKYRIVAHNTNSSFHRSLRIGYPTPLQVSAARRNGIDPGGDVMLHGIKNGLGWIGPFQHFIDWTRGCIAVTNKEIDEIWRETPDGTPVDIQP